MNSYYSTARVLLLKIASNILDTLEELHTVSIEFSVMREKGVPPSFAIDILYLPVEKKKQIS